ncbi:hypothetical protein SAMN05660909_05509 [Chitinophaga terrae (ex Kim and Jung 2007)]|uniref:Uncharacterized protein n=1 Tax=Chitinophaga terrae (ex Kim and Jung 2007) TaxID=408074 RepID=A0A1H4GM31_9BACT|nr:hypothetical protein [Chitinophaga terrae (ex Kim and Jung 2007)]SEB10665.1 hypothetical protein SAMN05660909_05509 [Chitinophaga terrae (ex Kim and Jung 2007)]
MLHAFPNVRRKQVSDFEIDLISMIISSLLVLSTYPLLVLLLKKLMLLLYEIFILYRF